MEKNKEWFEKMFLSIDGNDNWGHQYRITQRIRIEKSFKLLMHYLNPKKKYKIVDLCCGLGDFLVKFDNQELFGMDIAENAIVNAKKKYPQIPFSVNALPTVPMCADVIVTLECLYYINEEEALEEIYNKLNQHGYLLCSVPMEYEDRLLSSLGKFRVLETRYTYFGLFSKIESKLMFYSKELNYIIERKEARGKYLLIKLLKSRWASLIKLLMQIVRKSCFLILKSRVIVSLFYIFPIKQHIIILAQK